MNLIAQKFLLLGILKKRNCFLHQWYSTGIQLFVVGTHFKPQVWQNLAYDPITPTTWNVVGYTGYEFSDSYPVYGFTYADFNTPTQSAHRRKYDQVSFESVATGKKIQADPEQANG